MYPVMSESPMNEPAASMPGKTQTVDAAHLIVRLQVGSIPLPYPLEVGQTGVLIRYLGTKGLHQVPMAGVLFGTQYYQIPFDSLETLPSQD
jgi:hypothetical protein